MGTSIVLVAVFALLTGQTLAQEQCAVNRCDNGENCFNRDSPEGYVCECNQPFTHSYNCVSGTDNQEVFTCYGSDCKIGTFSSSNYPNEYPNRYRALYLLYIPGANGIRFTFNSPFGIETDKDELYIGKGLTVDYDLLNGVNTVGPDVLFFEGFETPAAATISNTDTAWLYFNTDKNLQYTGFSVQYQMLDSDPPVISNCPQPISTTTNNRGGAIVSWAEPTATDASAFTRTSTHTPPATFNEGTTTVTYTFVDEKGNTNTCSFPVTVTFSDISPPVITTFPEDITVTVPFGVTSSPVNWNEPTSTDNSGTSFQSPSQPSGSSFPVGTTPVTYTFTDPTGNTVQQTFDVTVIMLPDSTPPTVNTFPEDITVTVPFGSNSSPVNWPEPTSTDNSGTSFQSPSQPSGSTFPVGPLQSPTPSLIPLEILCSRHLMSLLSCCRTQPHPR
jgi:hypothetical protein